MHILDVKFTVIDIPRTVLGTVNKVALIRRNRAVIRYFDVVNPVHRSRVCLLVLFLLPPDCEESVWQNILYLTYYIIIALFVFIEQVNVALLWDNVLTVPVRYKVPHLTVHVTAEELYPQHRLILIYCFNQVVHIWLHRQVCILHKLLILLHRQHVY